MNQIPTSLLWALIALGTLIFLTLSFFLFPVGRLIPFRAKWVADLIGVLLFGMTFCLSVIVGTIIGLLRWGF